MISVNLTSHAYDYASLIVPTGSELVQKVITILQINGTFFVRLELPLLTLVCTLIFRMPI